MEGRLLIQVYGLNPMVAYVLDRLLVDRLLCEVEAGFLAVEDFVKADLALDVLADVPSDKDPRAKSCVLEACECLVSVGTVCCGDSTPVVAGKALETDRHIEVVKDIVIHLDIGHDRAWIPGDRYVRVGTG